MHSPEPGHEDGRFRAVSDLANCASPDRAARLCEIIADPNTCAPLREHAFRNLLSKPVNLSSTPPNVERIWEKLSVDQLTSVIHHPTLGIAALRALDRRNPEHIEATLLSVITCTQSWKRLTETAVDLLKNRLQIRGKTLQAAIESLPEYQLKILFSKRVVASIALAAYVRKAPRDLCAVLCEIIGSPDQSAAVGSGAPQELVLQAVNSLTCLTLPPHEAERVAEKLGKFLRRLSIYEIPSDLMAKIREKFGVHSATVFGLGLHSRDPNVAEACLKELGVLHHTRPLSVREAAMQALNRHARYETAKGLEERTRSDRDRTHLGPPKEAFVPPPAEFHSLKLDAALKRSMIEIRDRLVTAATFHRHTGSLCDGCIEERIEVPDDAPWTRVELKTALRNFGLSALRVGRAVVQLIRTQREAGSREEGEE